MTRLSAASLHGTIIADRMTPEERAALGIKGAAEISAHTEKSDERALQLVCQNLLRVRGIPFHHLSTRARESAGWPDLTFPLHGRFYGVELKAAKGKTSPEQDRTLDAIHDNGGVAKVIRTFDEFKRLLDDAHRVGLPFPDATLPNEAGLTAKPSADTENAPQRAESNPSANSKTVAIEDCTTCRFCVMYPSGRKECKKAGSPKAASEVFDGDWCIQWLPNTRDNVATTEPRGGE